MLMPMATSFYKFVYQGSALKKLHIKQTHLTRHPGTPFSSKQSAHFCCNTKKVYKQNYRTRIEFKKRCCHLQCHSQGKADYSNNIHDEEKEDNVTRATLIWRAIKLPIYSVALIPLTVGSAAAYLQTGIFSASRYFLLLASSVLIITWLNLRLKGHKDKHGILEVCVGIMWCAFLVVFTIRCIWGCCGSYLVFSGGCW